MVCNLAMLAIASILVPFVASLAIVVCPRPAAKAICIAAAGISTLCAIMTWIGLGASGADSAHVTLSVIGGIEIMGLTIDKVSVMLATAFVSIGLLISIYSVGYLNEGNREHPDKPRRRFYAFFTVFIGAMAGLVFSSTLIGQLMFFEITGACSWALIGYYDTPTARKSAMKALILTHIGSLGLYVATGALFLQTGSFSVVDIAQLGEGWKTFILLGVIFAAWAKSAQLPFYMWLPSAMEAPTPVSAYLHGASMVKVGVAVLARELMSAGAIPEAVGWVIVIGAIITCIFSFIMYLPQTDMKRLLAFSTISQLSYIFLAFGFYAFGSGIALEGGIAHIFNHAFAKTLFFLTAGAFSYTLGTRMLPQLRGVLKKQPLLGVAFAFAALAIAGVPPMNGFFSKTLIFAGGFITAANSGHPALMVIVVIALLETVGCFAWFLKWIGSVLFGEPSETVAAAQPVPRAMVVAFVVLLVMTVCSSFIAAAWLG